MAKAEEDEYRCEECDEDFDSETELRDHNERMHKSQQQKGPGTRRKSA
jgi:hypothetical protein